MKAIFKRTLMLLLAVTISGAAALAQKKISGVVYKDGKPAAGVEVSAHKSKDTFYTSFDGKYELTISSKTKYIRFAFPEKEEKLDIQGKDGNVFNYNFGGKPFVAPKANGGAIDLRSHSELIQAKVSDYMRQYNLFFDFYKQKDYQSALKPWGVLYKKYPKSSENIYIKGMKMNDQFINLSSTKVEKKELIEKEMAIYDQRAKYFGKKGFIEGRKALTYLQHMYNPQEMTDSQLKEVGKKGYNMLDSAIKEAGNDTKGAVLLLYMKVSADLFRIGELSKEQILTNYDKVSTILDANAESEDDSYQLARSQSDKIVVRSGALDCESIVAIYQPKFDANPDDVVMLKKMMALFRRQNCTDSELFNDGAEKLYNLDPSAGAAISLGQRYAKKQDAAKAIEFLKKALEMNKTEKIAENDAIANYMLGIVYFQLKNNYATAFKYAKAAIKADPEDGKYYILAGNILGVGAKTYGKDEFEHSMVYWLATDYFAKAKRVDASVAAEAQKKIATYKRYFPIKSELFFHDGMKPGQAVQLGGWINESTKAKIK
ncbi:tetratricopeptide repeat protein [Halosquirtibacter laminarini]|uniref:Tetratricopeptide repeat protein n=1 Tax=Halosquirtibacter laminarini TaxID=3374600 RepID=A0AC61ND99_9BACT|nr:tetratricopeptide repeat protein [Prolixibacteraceae bacterium]